MGNKIAKKTTKKTKKARVKRTKVTPSITPTGSVNFSKLRDQDCFLMYGSLWMKVGGTYNQNAVNLVDGKMERNLCGRMIVPVKVEIKWEKV